MKELTDVITIPIDEFNAIFNEIKHRHDQAEKMIDKVGYPSKEASYYIGESVGYFYVLIMLEEIKRHDKIRKDFAI